MPGLPLSPQVFALLAGLVEERAGLHYRTNDLELFRDKVSSRAEQQGFESLLDYYYFLKYDEGGHKELDALVEGLVVHETYFFREADQLRALTSKVLGPRLGGALPVRIWCAASATGEEAYTLAMLLAHAGQLERARILATDVSERAVDRARRGDFGSRALRALPPGIEGRFLHRRDQRVELEPHLREAIEWRRVNLVDPLAVASLGQFDAILARNVLIYFSDATVRRVVETLSGALAPGGVLLVSASESLLRYGTSLTCEEHGGAFFYRRVS